MAFYGPSNRTIEFDASIGGSLQDITDIVLEIGGVGAIEAFLGDMTDIGDTRPAHRPSGFASAEDITLKMEVDIGGSNDAEALFNGADITAQTGTRSFKITYGAAWSFAVETYIVSFKPAMPGREETTCEVTLRPTGDWTIT